MAYAPPPPPPFDPAKLCPVSCLTPCGCSYADGSSYEGGYAGGVRHGQGTFKFANGDM